MTLMRPQTHADRLHEIAENVIFMWFSKLKARHPLMSIIIVGDPGL